MNNSFTERLTEVLLSSLYNNFTDNFDQRRYGPLKTTVSPLKQGFVNYFLNKKFISGYDVKNLLRKNNEIIAKYGDRLSRVYDLLSDDDSKQELLDLVAFRILGHKKIKLKARRGLEERLKKEQVVFDRTDSIEATYLESTHQVFLANLDSIGYPIKLYATSIIDQFISEQYNYLNLIKADTDDVVIDAGACYGDSSLYFAHHVGSKGKVLAIEFIPGNISVIEKNKKLNPHLDIVDIVPHPLWSIDNKPVYYKDRGPGSKVEFERFEAFEGQVMTITIDTIVKDKGLKRVDFIKMDIEGAEPYALEGGLETIKNFKPKLAITNYHGMDDFVNIPLWIDELGLGYKIYLGHSTIHWEESVIFAIAD
ncbi:FkbM family methyltransferase [uncultured Roseivirga sp.]|uniref:FkbM family methyltransferase n=1 Tax=uncultured Roseivirga sp. TaxID=543088 RepID=UPI000D7B5E78|nr:FkbM family methyltransferase [uncultured Roseivirga sp.]PWL27232.1 MAG: hypothetical protein DCO95_17960 [Roseivirga sp. XM-24bin3]